MKKHLVAIAGLFLILLSSMYGQMPQLCVAYLNAQTSSLEEIQRQLAYRNLQQVGMAGQLSSTSLPTYSKKNTPKELWMRLEAALKNPTGPEGATLKDLLTRSEQLYQNIISLSKKDSLTKGDFQVSALLFEDIHILNQKITHNIQEQGKGYVKTSLKKEIRVHEEVLAQARKLLIAYRYELSNSISKLSEELAKIHVPAAYNSPKFTQDFRQILLTRIDQEELYNEKVLPAFNLWVEVYNEWITTYQHPLSAQVKLGPEFVPIHSSNINSIAKSKSPQNLIFLLDVSGSMRKPEKLPLIKKSIVQILPFLHKDDRIDILCFADNSQQIVSNYSPASGLAITQALAKLQALGNTQPYSSFEAAYKIAKSNPALNRRTQIIFLTDGGFEIDPERLPSLIEKQRYEGINLSIVYSGNHEAQVRNRLRKLAEIGNGHYLALNNANPAQNLLQVVRQAELPK